MFRGNFEHTVDDKGRVSVPARFRDALVGSNDDRVVITKFPLPSGRCLEVYPLAVWVRLEERMRQKPQFNHRVMRFMNFYFANAHECVLDKQGRILLPTNLRSYAGLEKDVVLAGIIDKFRIWDKAQWDRVSAEHEQQIIDNPEDLNELGI